MRSIKSMGFNSKCQNYQIFISFFFHFPRETCQLLYKIFYQNFYLLFFFFRNKISEPDPTDALTNFHLEIYFLMTFCQEVKVWVSNCVFISSQYNSAILKKKLDFEWFRFPYKMRNLSVLVQRLVSWQAFLFLFSRLAHNNLFYPSWTRDRPNHTFQVSFKIRVIFFGYLNIYFLLDLDKHF